MNARALRIGLVGVGMFAQDVHLPCYSQLHAHGLLPWLGRLGLDPLARRLGDIDIRFVAVAARSEASACAAQEQWQRDGMPLAAYWGDAPWEPMLEAHPELDVLAVATPDHLHAAPVLAALERGVHVIVEKPLCLEAQEADAILALQARTGCLVGVDMHKRYDPDHLRIRDELRTRIGEPLYGCALLEEPLHISTEVFQQWAAHSDPFSYVGSHWTDLFIAWYGAKPVSLHAVGQKRKLASEHGIDTFDAVQVKVTFDNGMSIDFINNWVTPDAFEAPVNQESRLVGTEGLVESDTQYRGLRYATTQRGTQTANTHFMRQVQRDDGSTALVGYSADSLLVCLARIAEMKFLGRTLDDVRGGYPDALEARLTVLIVHAARAVCARNHEYLQAGRGAPVTAHFGPEGVTLCDPWAGNTRLYEHPV